MTTSHQRRGLTLLELITVMAILAILISLVIGLGRYADTLTRRHQAVAEIGQWQEALHQYYQALGEYPTNPCTGSVSNLLVLRVPIGGAASNQVFVTFGEKTSHAGQLPQLDPWGAPYQYQAPPDAHPQSYDLYSYGPDRQGNSSDDLRCQP
jgi:general secretion pathway protein G